MKDRTNVATTFTCYSCGHKRPTSEARPFGRHADGRVATHVCLSCIDGTRVAPSDPRHDLVTIARLEVPA